MNVVFVEPFFPPTQRHFAGALAEVGATVIGLGEYPADMLDGELRGWLHHYEQVQSVTDVAELTRVVRGLQDNLWVESSRRRSRRTPCPLPRSGRPAQSQGRRTVLPGCAGTSRR